MVPTTFIGKLITFPAMMFGVLVSLLLTVKKITETKL